MPSQTVAVTTSWQSLTTLAGFMVPGPGADGNRYYLQNNFPTESIFLYESASQPAAGTTGLVVLPFAVQIIEQVAGASHWIRASGPATAVITNL